MIGTAIRGHVFGRRELDGVRLTATGNISAIYEHLLVSIEYLKIMGDTIDVFIHHFIR